MTQPEGNENNFHRPRPFLVSNAVSRAAREIKADCEKYGITMLHLAHKTGYSETHVYRVVNKGEGDLRIVLAIQQLLKDVKNCKVLRTRQEGNCGWHVWTEDGKTADGTYRFSTVEQEIGEPFRQCP